MDFLPARPAMGTTASDADTSEDAEQTPLDQTPLGSWFQRLEQVGRANEMTLEHEDTQRPIDVKDKIQSFDHVFVDLDMSTPDEEHLDDACHDPIDWGDVEDLGSGARVFYRNISDRYPTIPRHLAKRLAIRNMRLLERLHPVQSYMDITLGDSSTSSSASTSTRSSSLRAEKKDMAQFEQQQIYSDRLPRRRGLSYADVGKPGFAIEKTDNNPAYTLFELWGLQVTRNVEDTTSPFPILKHVLRTTPLMSEPRDQASQRDIQTSKAGTSSLKADIRAVFGNINILTANIVHLDENDVNVRLDEIRSHLNRIRSTLPETMFSESSLSVLTLLRTELDVLARNIEAFRDEWEIKWRHSWEPLDPEDRVWLLFEVRARAARDRLITNDELEVLLKPPRVTRESSVVSFWTDRPKRPGPHSSNSGSSSMNSSLQKGSSRGSSEQFEQSERFEQSTSQYGDSDLSSDEHYVDMILPPPPVDLDTKKAFMCDICGREVFILHQREWK